MSDEAKPVVRWVVWHPENKRPFLDADPDMAWLIACRKAARDYGLMPNRAAMEAAGWQCSEVRSNDR